MEAFMSPSLPSTGTDPHVRIGCIAGGPRILLPRRPVAAPTPRLHRRHHNRQARTSGRRPAFIPFNDADGWRP